MISDVLLDAAAAIRDYRKDYPFYDSDARMARWLDSITIEMEALAEAAGEAPPPDDRTITAECQGCSEITAIHIGTLRCADCQAKMTAQLEGLAELFANPEAQAAMDADMDAARTKRLDGMIAQAIRTLQRLSRADRDHGLAGISRGLLEAR